MRFCVECHTVLELRARAVENKLVYKCDRCGKEHDSPAKVYERSFGNEKMHIQEHLESLNDFSADPTFPRIRQPCPGCGNKNLIVVRPQMEDKALFTMFYYCDQPSCRLLIPRE